MRKGQTPALKRVIVDFKKLDKHMLNLLVEKFPDGYDDDDSDPVDTTEDVPETM